MREAELLRGLDGIQLGEELVARIADGEHENRFNGRVAGLLAKAERVNGLEEGVCVALEDGELLLLVG
jgi:hypothetical protein